MCLSVTSALVPAAVLGFLLTGTEVRRWLCRRGPAKARSWNVPEGTQGCGAKVKPVDPTVVSR
jgi:hypothetical protein